MSFQKIERKNNLKMIIEQIKEQIKNGELKVGDKLPPERKLAELFGVSRTSIREAIQALAFSGYLEVIQGKGAFVNDSALKYDEVSKLITKTSDFSLSDLMEVRIMMESEFAKLAAKRANKKDIKNIEKCFEEMKTATNVSTFVIEDLNFHIAIAEASHNKLMNSLMKIFGELLHDETNKIIEFSGLIQDEIIDISSEIVQAIKEGNTELAEEKMGQHISIVDKYSD